MRTTFLFLLLLLLSLRGGRFLSLFGAFCKVKSVEGGKKDFFAYARRERGGRDRGEGGRGERGGGGRGWKLKKKKKFVLII